MKLIKRTGRLLLITSVLLGHQSCGDNAKVQKDEKPAEKETEAPKRGSKGQQVGQVTFLSYCEQAKSGDGIETTIKALKAVVSEKDCKKAESKLSRLKTLQLQNRGISDLRPLASFTQLEKLSLSNNNVSDLSPISSLKDLSYLAISANKVRDLSPLAANQKLSVLLMSGNPVQDLTVVRGMPALSHVWYGEFEGKLKKFDSQSVSAVSEAPNLKWLSGENVCQGGWYYDAYNSCRHQNHGAERYLSKESAACGVKEKKTVAKTCRHEANGVERWKTTDKLEHFRSAYRKNSQQNEVADRLIGYCRNWGKQFEEPGVKVTMRPVVHRQAVIIIDCIAKIETPQRYRKAQNAACGHDVQYTYNRCEHPSHGIVDYAQGVGPECGTSSVIQRSATLQHKSEVEAHLGVVTTCSTCDAYGTDNAEELSLKLACYEQALNLPEVDLVEDIRRQMQTVFDTKASELSEAQAAFIMENI